MVDIYFQKEYGKLYETIEQGTCETFVYQGEAGTIQNMFILRPVPWLVEGVQYYDTITPYGYGGPLLTEGIMTVELTNNYEKAWTEYCIRKRIVAEFVRFHLFDNIQLREMYPGKVIKISDNIVRRLDEPMEVIWMEFEHKVRKNVKKAQRNGLTVTIDTTGRYLDNFLNIYYSTMERNHAKKYYYFDRNYFQKVMDSLSGRFQFFHVWYNGEIASTELVLCSERYVYSFLGGTLDKYYSMRPNDLVKYEIIRWSRETEHNAFILGGGYGGNDGIFRYKKSFAPGEDVPFFVGQRIHNEDVYVKLVKQRRAEGELQEAFFPLYRG